MSFAQQIARARASKNGDYFTAGEGQVHIKSFHHTVNGEDEEIFVLECVVLESRPVRTDILPNAPGSTCAAVFAVGAHGKVAWGHVKATLRAVAKRPDADGEEIAALATQYIEDCHGKEQPSMFPARGIALRYVTKHKTTKKGIEIDVPYFSPMKQTPEEIKAARAVIDEEG